MRALRMRTVLPANWRTGLADVVREGVFATPSISGWVLVVGFDLLRATHDSDDLENLLVPLSEEFGEVAWFTTDEAREAHGWAFAERGEMRRGYRYNSEQGHVYWYGDVMEAERDLECFLDDPRDHSDDEVKWWPDRQIVLALAAAWSIDPSKLSQLEGGAGRGAGWVGRI